MGQEVALRESQDLLPSKETWDRIKEIASYAVKSGLLPSSIKTAEAAAIVALKGHELGLKPMVAFSHIHVVNGKPGCSAELLLAAIYRDHPGVEIEFVQMDDKACVIRARRSAEKKLQEFKFTIEEAKNAQLTNKDVWKNYAVDMLRARAITRMKRAKFPEIMMGLDHTPEELETIEVNSQDATPRPSPTQEIEVKSIVESSTTNVSEPKPTAEAAPVIPIKPDTVPDAPKAEWEKEAEQVDLSKRVNPMAEREEIGKKINAERIRIGATSKELGEVIQQTFGKTPDQLTIDQLKSLLNDLSQRPPKQTK